ncbi:hypothetical protein OIU84_013015 [Salix udensis]|uniref:Uncharacterized protein n=1 Tax=Salix udensis TaxID=889485 RepID=A0AAD6NU08_9ROSI|nr:hypothetical protein OIU84_013015 [Salix udensis]
MLLLILRNGGDWSTRIGKKPPSAMQHPIQKPHRRVVYKFNENVDNSNFFMLTTSFRKLQLLIWVLQAMHFQQNHLDEDPRAAKFSVFSSLWKIACNSVDDINFNYKIIPITKLDSTTGHMVKDVKRCFAETMVLIARSSIYVGLFEESMLRRHSKYISAVVSTALEVKSSEENHLRTKRSNIGNPVKSIDKNNGFFFSGIEDSAVEFSKIAVRPDCRELVLWVKSDLL